MKKQIKKARKKAPKTGSGASSAGDLLHDWVRQQNELSWQEQLSWLRKPRLHTAVFQKAFERDLLTEPSEDKFPSPEIRVSFYRERSALIQEIEEIKNKLGWDTKRFDEFTCLAVAFRKEPSIEHYLNIRRNFPELDIQIGISGGIDPLFAIAQKFRQHGIDPELVASAMDGFEPGIDELCLKLMELIVARRKITGPRQLEQRRAAISDAMVNYLIAFMLEGLDWSDALVRIPASLILLIRGQLGPLRGDLHGEFESRETRNSAAWAVAQRLKPDE